MKGSILFFFFFASIVTANAGTDCTADVEKVLSDLAPKTGEVKIVGKYNKKSESGEYKNCSLSIKLDGTRVVPKFSHTEFNPMNGDGGAFWPFGSYPTVEIPTNEYNKLISYNCSAKDNGFSVDYIYKSRSGWRKTSRYTLSLEKNKSGTYDASLRAGNGSVFEKLTTCTGTISEE